MGSVDEDYLLSEPLSGLYIDGNIALSNRLNTTAEKACVLAEELEHHETSVGNIIDLSVSWNRKQERQARPPKCIQSDNRADGHCQGL